MPRLLELQPLSRDAFAPFGDVIETEGAVHFPINNGTTERFHDLAAIDAADGGGRPLVNIFRGQPRPRPIEIRMMEKHPLGSQAFVPLRDAPYLVVVAAAGDKLAPADLVAFRASGRQGVNYRRGVWHHPLLVLEPDHDFLVIDRGGPSGNCVEYSFAAEDDHALIRI